MCDAESCLNSVQHRNMPMNRVKSICQCDKGSVLVLPGMDLIFFIVAHIVLQFGFVMKIELIAR